MSPRRLVHWDDYGVVLYGGVPAMRNETVLNCLSGLRSMVFSWRELDAVRLVEPYPAIEVSYEFEGFRQRETVLPGGGVPLDQFSEHVLGFCEEVEGRRGPEGVSDGWRQIPAVPWESVAHMPNDPTGCSSGVYRSAPGRGPITAVRWPAGVGERCRVLLFRGEAFGAGAQANYERMLAQQQAPWTVRGSEVLLTPDHVYARTRRGVVRMGLEVLRRRIDLPQLRLYLFGRRSVLLLADRRNCPLQRALDRLLTPRLLKVAS